MKLKLMSPNLILLLQEILKNQNLCKLINYNVSNPYIQPNINGNSLMLSKVYPFPFSTTVETTEGTQLRVYYQDANFKTNQTISDSTIYFDIICSKSQSIWLINDGSPKIRPYEIMSHLVDHFSEKEIPKIGKLNFRRFIHVNVNDKFDCIRIFADAKMVSR